MDQNFVIRPLNSGDLNWLYDISDDVGPGFTSLQHSKHYLSKRIDIIEKSFNEQLPIKERIFMFVRENLPSGDPVGLAGIDISVGHHESFYNFQISTITQSCKKLDLYLVHNTIHLVTNFQQASELISFWVHPDHRGHDIGKSLSLSRFLFMKQFAAWFGQDIIAEVRGVCDSEGKSPFWDAVGCKFFGMEFKKADYLTMTSGKQYISDLAPREPIYIDLLPEAAQKVIGTEHPHSQAARHLLESEGFKFNNHIDIFDGGPLLSAERDQISTLKNTKTVIIAKLTDQLAQGTQALIYNNQLAARITVHNILQLNDNEVAIAPHIAEILQVTVGDSISYCPIQF